MVTSHRGKWVFWVEILPVLIIRASRELPDSLAIKTLSLSREPNSVHVNIGYENEQERLPKASSSTTPVGLDIGVASRITLSNGRHVKRQSTDSERGAALQ